MNKRSIILLSVFIPIAFWVIVLQIKYLNSLLDMRVQHFNEAANAVYTNLAKH